MISRIIDYNKSRFIQDKDNEFQNKDTVAVAVATKFFHFIGCR